MEFYAPLSFTVKSSGSWNNAFNVDGSSYDELHKNPLSSIADESILSGLLGLKEILISPQTTAGFEDGFTSLKSLISAFLSSGEL